jgi:hypothetical protein
MDTLLKITVADHVVTASARKYSVWLGDFHLNLAAPQDHGDSLAVAAIKAAKSANPIVGVVKSST